MAIDGRSNLLPLLLLNQFLTRFVTFFLNILTVRHVGAIAFGIASIHLYLIYTTILFLSREPFRRATLQVGFKLVSTVTSTTRPLTTRHTTPPPSSQHTTTSNLTYQLSLLATLRAITYTLLPIGTFLALLLSYISIVNPPELGTNPILRDNITYSTVLNLFTTIPTALITFKLDLIPTTEWYIVGVGLFSGSALIELASEHLYLHTTRINNTKTRVTIETVANIARCIVTYFTVIGLQWTNQLTTGTAILSYGLGQLAFSTTLTLGYYGYYFYHIMHKSKHIFIGDKTIAQFSSAPAKKKELDTDQKDDQLVLINHLQNPECLLFSSPSQLIPFIPQYSIRNPLSTQVFDLELWSWFRAFFFQTIFKHFLTEGEKMVLVAMSPFTPEQNGAYALVINLGGLFVRLVLQPLEESSQQVFSSFHRDIRSNTQVLVDLRSSFTPDELGEVHCKPDPDRGTQQKSKPQQEQNEDITTLTSRSNPKAPRTVSKIKDELPQLPSSQTQQGKQCTDQLHTDNYSLQHKIQLQLQLNQLSQSKHQLKTKLQQSLLLSTYIGLILSTFGPPMSYSAIRIIYGEHWAEDTTAPAVLAMYALAQLFFGLNGIAEGFLFSTMQSTGALYSANIVLVLCSLFYVGVMIVFTQFDVLLESFGTQGLIVANMIGMLLRIAYSFSHIYSYFQPTSVEIQLSNEGFVPQFDDAGVAENHQGPTLDQKDEYIDNINKTINRKGRQTQPKTNSDDQHIRPNDDPDSEGYSESDADDGYLTHPHFAPPSLTNIIHWCFPSRLPRWFLFAALLYSHFIGTYFLFPFLQGFDEYGLNVFKMVIKSAQYFVTEAVPYNEPRKQFHSGPEYVQKYLAPSLRQHFMTVAFVAPVFVIFIGLMVKFDRHRLFQR